MADGPRPEARGRRPTQEGPPLRWIRMGGCQARGGRGPGVPHMRAKGHADQERARQTPSGGRGRLRCGLPPLGQVDSIPWTRRSHNVVALTPLHWCRSPVWVFRCPARRPSRSRETDSQRSPAGARRQAVRFPGLRGEGLPSPIEPEGVRQEHAVQCSCRLLSVLLRQLESPHPRRSRVRLFRPCVHRTRQSPPEATSSRCVDLGRSSFQCLNDAFNVRSHHGKVRVSSAALRPKGTRIEPEQLHAGLPRYGLG